MNSNIFNPVKNNGQRQIMINITGLSEWLSDEQWCFSYKYCN